MKPELTANYPKHPSVAICAKECGAKCCHNYQQKVQVAFLTPEEAVRLRSIDIHAPIVPNQKGDRWLMFLKDRCSFLGKDNLCNIYNERPEACKIWPRKPVEWCALWPR